MYEQTPRHLGKCELLSELGKGGMATVYRARLRGPREAVKEVAVKLLHSHLAREQDFLLMFFREVRVAMSLSHRNVVQTFDAGEEQGRHYMVMEFVEGDTLRRILDGCTHRGELLPLDLALFIGMEVCAALDYAHAHQTGDGKVGMIHRDVSPSNILLSRRGDVKLTDFGVARAAGHLTIVQDAIKGKLGYMAPEQAYGDVEPRAGRRSIRLVNPRLGVSRSFSVSVGRGQRVRRSVRLE